MNDQLGTPGVDVSVFYEGMKHGRFPQAPFPQPVSYPPFHTPASFFSLGGIFRVKQGLTPLKQG